MHYDTLLRIYNAKRFRVAYLWALPLQKGLINFRVLAGNFVV